MVSQVRCTKLFYHLIFVSFIHLMVIGNTYADLRGILEKAKDFFRLCKKMDSGVKSCKRIDQEIIEMSTALGPPSCGDTMGNSRHAEAVNQLLHNPSLDQLEQKFMQSYCKESDCLYKMEEVKELVPCLNDLRGQCQPGKGASNEKSWQTKQCPQQDSPTSIALMDVEISSDCQHFVLIPTKDQGIMRIGKGATKSFYRVFDYPSFTSYAYGPLTEKSYSRREDEILNSILGLPAVERVGLVSTIRSDEKMILQRLYDSDLDKLMSSDAASASGQTAKAREYRNLQILLQLGQGLSTLHQFGTAHSDIKPGNILIKNANSSNLVEAVYTDFNIALREGKDTNFRGGTTEYLSPQQRDQMNKASRKALNPEIFYSSDIFTQSLVAAKLLYGGNKDISQFFWRQDECIVYKNSVWEDDDSDDKTYLCPPAGKLGNLINSLKRLKDDPLAQLLASNLDAKSSARNDAQEYVQEVYRLMQSRVMQEMKKTTYGNSRKSSVKLHSINEKKFAKQLKKLPKNKDDDRPITFSLAFIKSSGNGLMRPQLIYRNSKDEVVSQVLDVNPLDHEDMSKMINMLQNPSDGSQRPYKFSGNFFYVTPEDSVSEENPH